MACLRLRRFSHGSWLLFRLFFTDPAFVFVDISMIGWSKRPPMGRFSLLWTVLQLCHSLGIVVNWEKSRLIPTQRMVYLRVQLDYLFHGFSCPKESREASLNWRRILVLRRAASVILARALRSAVFNDSVRSVGMTSDAVSSISPPSFLGSCRPDDPYPLDSRDMSGSGESPS